MNNTIFGKVNTLNMNCQETEFIRDGNFRCKIMKGNVRLINTETSESIKIPLKHWQSLVMFLSEGCCIAEGESGVHDITLTINESV